MGQMSKLPTHLQEIVDDFSYCNGQEKLEYLLQFAESLPPLPAWLEGKQNEMDHVHECMTPVFIFAEKKEDGSLMYHFDIPPEAPTVRGYAAILQQGLVGATPAQIQEIPNEFYLQMGLQKVITGQRLNGLSAMLSHMKALARKA
jgi:cysteine desulfuration protein SufE